MCIAGSEMERKSADSLRLLGRSRLFARRLGVFKVSVTILGGISFRCILTVREVKRKPLLAKGRGLGTPGLSRSRWVPVVFVAVSVDLHGIIRLLRKLKRRARKLMDRWRSQRRRRRRSGGRRDNAFVRDLRKIRGCLSELDAPAHLTFLEKGGIRESARSAVPLNATNQREANTAMTLE